MFAAVCPQGFGELYDLTADPWEQRNLWTSPDYREVVGDLESSLLEWLITTTRPHTTVGTSRHPSLMPQSRQDFRCVVQADGKIPGSTLARTADIKYL